ncbi:hypothetical protein [Massilia sp. Se16.2.3]|uniref:hypothetical protein n=1 Tax=Massilia sp. Se16.2.3 TaxID=2709303 RepID=UPI001E52D46F|nr:hypothetical protein [Massilia sp. Se16.2.3]
MVRSRGKRRPCAAAGGAARGRHRRLQGSRVEVGQVAGPQFWAAPETVDCPALLAATSLCFESRADA